MELNLNLSLTGEQSLDKTHAKTDAMRADGEEPNSAFKMAAKYRAVLFLYSALVFAKLSSSSKALTPDHMRQNLDIFGFDIDDGDMALIDTMDRVLDLPFGLTMRSGWIFFGEPNQKPIYS